MFAGAEGFDGPLKVQSGTRTASVIGVSKDL